MKRENIEKAKHLEKLLNSADRDLAIFLNSNLQIRFTVGLENGGFFPEVLSTGPIKVKDDQTFGHIFSFAVQESIKIVESQIEIYKTEIEKL